MKQWKLAGLTAAVVIVLTIPLYVIKVNAIDKASARVTQEPAAAYVGGKKCMECHKKEYNLWKDSHHDKAMDNATEKTVLGDFNNAVFESGGVKTRFYRKNGKFFVYTAGIEGKMREFEVAYTFGFTPLQQYLIPFPGGRLQCLPYAWDVNQKKWFHLYPEENPAPGEWLYWTNAGQNWNGMCAECHSTNLVKGYDFEKDTYHTTWSEIDVNCEACHGPGSKHVDWAELPGMARSMEVENLGLVVRTRNLDAASQVKLCAHCHARRTLYSDYNHQGKDMMDNLNPELLSESFYYPDGQFQDEVFEYGSFTQSKMFQRGIGCKDCHNVHSVKPVKTGNELCFQCHRASDYDTKVHHFHKQKGEAGEPILLNNGKNRIEVGEGTLCVKCHMPVRCYMGNDYRFDHSLRVPRPDISASLSVPNSCAQCHPDKSIQWAVDTINKNHGPARKSHYAAVLDDGRKRLPSAAGQLVQLANDPLYPVVVRSTALVLLNDYPVERNKAAYLRALNDSESLIRHIGIRFFNSTDPEERVKNIAPLLYDPVKGVRIEAAMNLTSVPGLKLNERQEKVFREVLAEYRKAMEYSADLPFARFNLGNMYSNLGQVEEAVKQYKMAIQLNKDYYPAKINLAMLYNGMGKNAEAEILLRQVWEMHPQFYEVAYSLGLLLAEGKRYDEAVVFMEKAAGGLSRQARVFYNLGLLYRQLNRTEDARSALSKTLEIEPDNTQYRYAAAGL